METNNQNELTDPGWPSVLRMPADEFRQSLGLAQVALQLCALQKAELQNAWDIEDKKYRHDINKAVTDVAESLLIQKRQEQMARRMKTLDAEAFLDRAAKLVHSARENVVRPQTTVEYMVAQGETPEALANAIGHNRRKSYVPFEKLCNAKRKEGDTEVVEGVSWKVYRSERGFEALLWKYWGDIGEKWKRGDQEIGTVQKLAANRKPRKINFYSESERKELATLARDTDAWKEHGELLLDSWKKNGIPLPDFFALAKFRRTHDKRAANLKKPKRRRLVKGRTQQRNRRDARTER